MRGGGTDGIGAAPTGGDVKDLRQLWNTLETGGLYDYTEKIKSNIIRDETPPVFLNPEFDSASILAGGADPDVKMGGMLIDIETTESGRFTSDHYHRLVGYWALSIPARVRKAPQTWLGVYFSRHGVLSVIDTPAMSDADIERFLNEFGKIRDIHKPACGA